MLRNFKPRYSIPLQSGVPIRRPSDPHGWVRMDDPALSVFTDFLVVPPRTVEPHVPIDRALSQMKRQKVRLLLVVDEREEVIGVVTAKDIQGEKPIKLIQTTRVQRSALTVRDVMTPQAQMSALNMISVQDAQVGHIVATLQQLERQHALVVDVDEGTGRQVIRGMFSTSQIQKQMHRDDLEEIPPAHSLAEIVKNVG